MHVKDFICSVIDEKRELIAKVNERIWTFAEYGYHEEKSAALLCRVLEEEGFSVERGIADISTAFVGSYGDGGPIIGILAEYDALPGLSQKAGSEKKTPADEEKEYGHGCGHSALGAGSLAAAIAVKSYLVQNKISGTVKIFGCPAEENGYGKVFMLKAGCFEDLDSVFTWHPGDCNGTIAVRNVAYYSVKFSFKGKSSHAAVSPQLGRSALDACELMNVGVNYLREHIIPEARVHYAYLDAGGEAPNVVQDHASLLYFIRAPKLELSAEILTRIKDIAKGAALMTGTAAEVQVLGGMNDLIPNAALAQVLSDAFQETGGPDFDEPEYEIGRRFLSIVPEEERKALVKKSAAAEGLSEAEFERKPLCVGVAPFNPETMSMVMISSSDVGDVSYKVPTAQLMAAVGIPGTPFHTWQLTAQVGTSIGSKAAAAAGKAMALAAVRVMLNPEIAEEAKAELFKHTGGKYLSPIDEIKEKGD